jgi:hypothetical protein
MRLLVWLNQWTKHLTKTLPWRTNLRKRVILIVWRNCKRFEWTGRSVRRDSQHYLSIKYQKCRKKSHKPSHNRKIMELQHSTTLKSWYWICWRAKKTSWPKLSESISKNISAPSSKNNSQVISPTISSTKSSHTLSNCYLSRNSMKNSSSICTPLSCSHWAAELCFWTS